VAHLCNPCTWEAKERESQIKASLGYIANSTSKDPSPPKKKEKEKIF
jgi:hypothetical protein